MFHLTLFTSSGLIALGQVLMIDIMLAGDNAVVIGLAAAKVPVHLRKKVILWGLIAAVAEQGLSALMDELRAVEADDPDGVRFPRFKQSDDATALFVEVV